LAIGKPAIEIFPENYDYWHPYFISIIKDIIVNSTEHAENPDKKKE
jgi:hypothetical protein